MPFDFSAFRVSPGEKPASSTKFNNFLQAVQDGMNAVPGQNMIGFPSDATKFLDGSGGWTAPPTDMVQVLTATTPTADFQGGPNDLFSFTIPAGKMGPNAALKFWADGELLNFDTAGRTLRLQLYLGPQLIWDSAPSDGIGKASAAGNRRAWRCNGIVQSTGGGAASTAQRTDGLFEANTQNNSPPVGRGAINQINTSDGLWGPFIGAATTVNMTGSQVFRLAASLSAVNANLIINRLYARVEVTA